MTMAASLAECSRPARLFKFVIDSHPPLPYLILSACWSWSLMLMLQRAGGNVRIAADMFVVSVTFFLILLFLRAVDEIKDLDYDRLHHPERPLVRGDVSTGEVWLLAAATAGLAIFINLLLAPRLALFAILNMSYGLGLLLLERCWRRFRESILLNLMITFPVSASLNVYAYLYLDDRGTAAALSLALPVIAAHVAMFLHLEFGRKLKWPHLAAPGENGYAMALGAGGAITVCAVLGAIACGLATRLHLQLNAALPWLPWLALLPSIAGILKFAHSRQRHSELKPYFAASLLLFFVTNLVATVSG